MIISNSKNFIFIHLEKCGGTSIEVALEPHLSIEDIILGSTKFGEEVQNAYVRRFGMNTVDKNWVWKHSNADNIKKHLGDEIYNSMYKFATVRNPIQIVKSLYFYSKKHVDPILKRIENPHDWLYAEQYPHQWAIGETFMLNYAISEIKGGKLDMFAELFLKSGHQISVPQILRTGKDVELFDIAFINNSWEQILEKINISNAPLIPLNASPRNEINLSLNMEEKIKHHFKLDYESIPQLIRTDW